MVFISHLRCGGGGGMIYDYQSPRRQIYAPREHAPGDLMKIGEAWALEIK